MVVICTVVVWVSRDVNLGDVVRVVNVFFGATVDMDLDGAQTSFNEVRVYRFCDGRRANEDVRFLPYAGIAVRRGINYTRQTAFVGLVVHFPRVNVWLDVGHFL